ncbi:phosphotransferase family protein [Dactylonectria macrodidyma]|uniref:Phosphotransferase family protein n=1 Tax=Dactylonectria macrodidyma TaxID=307937 RepID=A0A9P9JRI9_9HYPO|nr:phosphotransferase family protein [Dactylonectria macrodidyma]
MGDKTRFYSMERDRLKWGKVESDAEMWREIITTTSLYRQVCEFILRFRPGVAVEMCDLFRGGYNDIYRLRYADGTSVIMRVPIKGVVRFPDEKVLYEAATMKHIAAHTSIPVPHIYHYGTGAENPTGLGPFIIMDYIEHHQTMNEALVDPALSPGERPVLNPAIDEERLEFMYRQMANILLQLFNLRFPRIGSVVEAKRKYAASITGRPLTRNMNDMIMQTNTPESVLPTGTFGSTSEWFRTLGNMHMAQLVFQRNDAVDNLEDAREKYVARQLLRNLSTEGRLVPEPPKPSEPSRRREDFILFSEDFRPANVLINVNLEIVGVVDWEFAFAAPARLSYAPPWWLLLKKPEYWIGGYREWVVAYEPRFQTFLRALVAEERRMAATRSAFTPYTNGKAEPPLSQRMVETWTKRDWVLTYAMRKSWSFDFLWWKYLDEYFYGPNATQDYNSRLHLLTQPQKDAMDAFVARKMEESETPVLELASQWDDGGGADRLAEVLV